MRERRTAAQALVPVQPLACRARGLALPGRLQGPLDYNRALGTDRFLSSLAKRHKRQQKESHATDYQLVSAGTCGSACCDGRAWSRAFVGGLVDTARWSAVLASHRSATHQGTPAGRGDLARASASAGHTLTNPPWCAGVTQCPAAPRTDGPCRRHEFAHARALGRARALAGAAAAAAAPAPALARARRGRRPQREREGHLRHARLAGAPAPRREWHLRGRSSRSHAAGKVWERSGG